MHKITAISETQTGNIELFAKFTPKVYSISYSLNGRENSDSNPGEYSYSIGVQNFEKAGYTFDGWYADSSFMQEITTISETQTGNVELFAKFIPKIYNITYSLDNGKNGSGNSINYTHGVGVQSFEEAKKEGCIFDGWYTSPTLTYVTYNLKEMKSYTLHYGDAVPKQEAEQDAGYTFAGWVIEGANSKWTAKDTMPADDIILVATYDKNPEIQDANPTSNYKGNLTKTGDTSSLIPIIIIFSVAIIALITLAVVLVKKKEER